MVIAVGSIAEGRVAKVEKSCNGPGVLSIGTLFSIKKGPPHISGTALKSIAYFLVTVLRNARG